MSNVFWFGDHFLWAITHYLPLPPPSLFLSLSLFLHLSLSGQACFSGGMFALGSSHATNGQSEHHMELARGVANVCHESYQRTGM